MGYKKIDQRMWGDEKFLNLSRDAKFLWIYLLTGPHNTSLPGIFVAGEAMLAEAMHEPLEDFRRAFQELFQHKMVAFDWKVRVVFIPNVIKYDHPDNPNVAKYWGKLMNDIPECSLKTLTIRTFSKLLGKPFKDGLRKGLASGFVKGLIKGSAKGMPTPKPTPKPFPIPKPTPKPELNKEKTFVEQSSTHGGVPEELFKFWQHQLSHPKSKLDKKRRNAIQARLKEGYSPDRIRQAILGIKKSAHNMGHNDRNAVFDDIELICRSGANVDRFADMMDQNIGPDLSRYRNALISINPTIPDKEDIKNDKAGMG